MGVLTIFLLIAAVFVSVATIGIGLISLSSGQRLDLRTRFFRHAMAAGLWILSNVAFVWTSGGAQYGVALLSYAFALAMVVELYAFCLLLINKQIASPQKWVIRIGALLAILSAMPGVVASGVEDLAVVTRLWPLVGYALVVVGFLAASLLVLSKGTRSTDGAIKSQSRAIVRGFLLATAIGLVCNLILPFFGMYELVVIGPMGVGLFVYSISYSMVNYQLFDTKLAAVRSMAYTLSLTTFGALYFLLAFIATEYVFQRDFQVANIFTYFGISLLLLLMFQPLKRFFDRITNRIFYHNSYDEDEFFSRFTQQLDTSLDLRRLLNKVAREIVGTFNSDFVFFVVYDEDKLVSVGTPGYRSMAAGDARSLKQMLGKQDGAVSVDSLDPGSDLRRMMVGYRTALIVPLRRKSRVLGFMLLSEYKGRIYTKRDLKVLNTISSELSIAVQNAMAVQEIKNLNQTLQQRIEEATAELQRSNKELQRLDEAKDEFISMASHQLRTPLTSIKGYISMVLDGDVGKISATQRKLLGEAFTSSNRMVHLINDFLNVSRLQTGRFMLDRQLTDIHSMIKQEVDGLETTAKARGLEIQYAKPKQEVPKLYIDEGKVRQVVMNFIDNAIYYSPPESRIYVHLGVEGDSLSVTVEDTGIGVPKSEQERLFGKFFRASNARKHRPDGTGVGLFLAKRVIYEHGGRMIFKSKEGRGSTFGFKLPIKRLSLAPRDDTD